MNTLILSNLELHMKTLKMDPMLIIFRPRMLTARVPTLKRSLTKLRQESEMKH